MANRFFNPNEQFCDAAGLPYAGGTLAFFASGTSTPLNTFSDSGLSIANTNPVVLDSAGRANSVFLQNLAYKVVLSDVNSNIIWTEDPVYASDYSTRAKLTSGSGSPNGSVAGTAGSTGIGADTYWDIVNNILYVCTTTGNAAIAVWTAVNATTAAAIVPSPQGYLTPTSGTPIITSGYGSGEINSPATSLVYTPYVGNIVPIFSGIGFTPTVFSELTLTLVSSHAANTIYDVFIFNNSGVLTLVTGPAWTTSTAGSGSRGSPTALTRLSGILVNNISITGRNGSTTYTIPANQATYLGSIFIDGVAGQVSLNRTYGQNRKWGVWNAYNRVRIYLKAGDSTATWNYATNTIRASNGFPASYTATVFNAGSGITANGLTIFSGLAEEFFDIRFVQTATPNSANGNTFIGIGLNSITATSGFNGFAGLITNLSAQTTNMIAEYMSAPSLGVNNISGLENSPTATSETFRGTESNMVLMAQWNG